MPVSWTDTFSHDYFADHTYTLLAGVEGTDFNLSGGQFVATGTSTWVDPRRSHLFSNYFTTITASNLVTAGTATVVTGLTTIDESHAILGAYEDGGVLILEVISSTDSGDNISLSTSLSLSGATTLTLSVLNGVVTCTTSSGGLLTATMAPTLVTDLSGHSLYPFAEVSAPVESLTITQWTYDDISSNPIFRFDATLSEASSPGRLVAWNWLFDDNSTASGPIIEKTFLYGSGVHPVTLTVTDDRGRKASLEQTIIA